MEMSKVKTCDLKGAALDWAVAMADKSWEWAHKIYPTMTLDPTFTSVTFVGEQCLLIPRNPFRQDPQIFEPSKNWEHCGQLIDKLKIGIEPSGEQVYAYLKELSLDGYFGDTATIAICRAIVGAKVGDEIEIPKELADQCAT